VIGRNIQRNTEDNEGRRDKENEKGTDKRNGGKKQAKYTSWKE